MFAIIYYFFGLTDMRYKLEEESAVGAVSAAISLVYLFPEHRTAKTTVTPTHRYIVTKLRTPVFIRTGLGRLDCSCSIGHRT
jgi:hypothetical protein